MNCSKCGRPVIEASLSGQRMVLDFAPSNDGNVLVLNGNATYLDGLGLGDARRLRIPLYRRHGIHCPNFWNREDLRP